MSKHIEIPPRDTSAPVRIPQGRNQIPASQSKKPSGVFSERHTSAQEVLYREWSAKQTTLLVTFDDGSSMVGILQAYDTYALQIDDTDGIPTLIFKQSVRSIRPT